MVLDRPFPRPLAWAGLLGLMMLLAALATVPWLSRESAAGRSTASALTAVDMAALEGEYRGEGMVLRLRLAEGVLWARSGEGRWERLAVRGQHRLRATTLGYEIDTSALRAGSPAPQVLRLVVGGQSRDLARQFWPLVGGVPTVPYLRGTMNDWQPVEPLVGNGADRYGATLELARGSYDFKIGSQEWNRIDFGGHGPLRADGQALPLVPVGPNIGLTIAEPGRYRFTLDLREPLAPRVSVTRLH